MIYTIGKETDYLKTIEQHGKIHKLGKRGKSEKFPEGYEGGYAFRTIEEAENRILEAYLTEGYSVFGIMANWEDTEPSETGWWHHLLVDAEIVVLEY